MEKNTKSKKVKNIEETNDKEISKKKVTNDSFLTDNENIKKFIARAKKEKKAS